MSEWKEYKLGDVCDLLDCLHKTPTYVKEGYPMVRVTDIKNGAIDLNGCLKVSESVYHAFLKGYYPKVGDIAFSRVGSFGNSSIVKKESKFCIGQNTTLIIPKKIDPFFAFYYLISKDARAEIDGLAGGSTQPTISMKSIREITFPYPPLPEQKLISETLSSLDDKIDLLHRQNKTLEALAETLFRQWFVEEAEESWENGKLDDVISVKGGTTPSTIKPEFWNGNIHWTSPRDLSNHNSIFLFDTERRISERGLKEIGSGLLPIGTVLLSSRAPIGYLAITEIPVAINQGYIAILCDKLVSNYFIYLWCKANMPDIENAGNGSVFQEISKTTFRSLDFKIPPTEKLKLFDKEVEPMFQKIKSNAKQIKTLTQLRDTLLPKLMSGEVRVENN